MKLQNKLKALMQITNTKQIDIANKLGVTQANISKKLNGNSIRVEDFIEMVEAAGGTVEINIVLPDGTKF